jgi:hypothetical protein
MSDFFGKSKITANLGPRLEAIQTVFINEDSCISLRPDNSITTFKISSYGKSLLQLTDLNGLIKLIQQGDSKVEVDDTGVGSVEVIVDNEIIGIWNINGLTMQANKNLYAHTIMSASGPVKFFSDVKPVIGTLNFGTNAERWNNIFASTIDTNVLISTGAGDINVNCNFVTNNGLYIGGNIIPYTGGMPIVPQNIGSVGLAFENVYSNQVLTDYIRPRTNNPTLNNIRFQADQYSANIQAFSGGNNIYNNLYIRSSGSGDLNLQFYDGGGGLNSYMRNGYDPAYPYGAQTTSTLNSISTNHIVPNIASAYSLGHTNKRWLDIYSINAPIHSSDLNLKTDIIESSLGLEFINKLNPVEYKWKESQSNRTHYGFIAQEIRDILGHENNKNNHAMYVYSPATSREIKNKDGTTEIIEEEESFSLRYAEFTSPIVKAIQELSNKIENLENNTKVEGDTVILNTNTPVKQSSSYSNSSTLEKKLDELIGRVFTLENKGNVEEESEGDFSIIDNLQNRVHSLEMLCNKLEKNNKKLTSVVNKLLKGV